MLRAFRQWRRTRKMERQARREGYGTQVTSALQDKMFNQLTIIANGSTDRVMSAIWSASHFGARPAPLSEVLSILRNPEGKDDGN